MQCYTQIFSLLHSIDISIRYCVRVLSRKMIFLIKYVLSWMLTIQISHPSFMNQAVFWLLRSDSQICYSSQMEGYTPVTASFRSHRGIVCHVYCTYEGHILYDLWHMQPPYGLSALLNITSIWCSETAVHTDVSEKTVDEVTQAHILLCLWVLCLPTSTKCTINTYSIFMGSLKSSCLYHNLLLFVIHYHSKVVVG